MIDAHTHTQYTSISHGVVDWESSGPPGYITLASPKPVEIRS